MAVVKANAYGHGAVPAALTLQGAGVHSFAVASLGEAVELRSGGVIRPILVLGYTPAQQAAEALRRTVTLTVFDAETAAMMTASPANKPARIAVHVKVNTGMNRLGCLHKQRRLTGQLRSLPKLVSRASLLTLPLRTSWTRATLSSVWPLRRIARASCPARLRPPVAHAANSAALVHHAADTPRPGAQRHRPVRAGPRHGTVPLPQGFQPALSGKRSSPISAHCSQANRSATAASTRRTNARGGDSGRLRRRVSAPAPYVGQRPDPWPRRRLSSAALHGSNGRRRNPDRGKTGPMAQGEEVVLIGRQGDAVSGPKLSARASPPTTTNGQPHPGAVPV